MGGKGSSGWCDILSSSSMWPGSNICAESFPKDPTVLFGWLTLRVISPAYNQLSKIYSYHFTFIMTWQDWNLHLSTPHELCTVTCPTSSPEDCSFHHWLCPAQDRSLMYISIDTRAPQGQNHSSPPHPPQTITPWPPLQSRAVHNCHVVSSHWTSRQGVTRYVLSRRCD